jgi:hypothetical protein
LFWGSDWLDVYTFPPPTSWGLLFCVLHTFVANNHVIHVLMFCAKQKSLICFCKELAEFEPIVKPIVVKMTRNFGIEVKF